MLARGLEELAKVGKTALFGVEDPDELPFVVDDALVTASVDGLAYEAAKMAALREHRTQVTPDGPFFEMAELIGPEAFGREYFRLAKGTSGQHTDENGWETDLFDGVA
jgi:N-acetyl-1-D-myo-inositol-2-amino-2-deoxy-alpha-D-glucopyranoside deacetylase